MQETINLKKFFDEDKWTMKHYKELQEKYPDEWVVIKDNKVIKHEIKLEHDEKIYRASEKTARKVFSKR